MTWQAAVSARSPSLLPVCGGTHRPATRLKSSFLSASRMAFFSTRSHGTTASAGQKSRSRLSSKVTSCALRYHFRGGSPHLPQAVRLQRRSCPSLLYVVPVRAVMFSTPSRTEIWIGERSAGVGVPLRRLCHRQAARVPFFSAPRARQRGPLPKRCSSRLHRSGAVVNSRRGGLKSEVKERRDVG